MTHAVLDVLRRAPMRPWVDGDKIPWHEPGFSARMLQEHLTQSHDAASRRFGPIDRHVDWIHTALLGGLPARVLDLGCGPGLYASRLARLGHMVRGIDFSPASIDYARAQASDEGLTIDYTLRDIRVAEYGAGLDLVMFIYGELNVFTPADALAILAKARAALKPGGSLLLEVSTHAGVRAIGAGAPSWWTAESGLFWERPHLGLSESAWLDDARVAVERWFIVDAESGELRSFGATTQAYTDEGYRSMLAACGFEGIEIQPTLGGVTGSEAFQAIVAMRPAGES